MDLLVPIQHLSEQSEKRGREGKRKQLRVVWFGKDEGVSVPQVDTEEGSLDTLTVTLPRWLTSRRGDPVSKRMWFEPLEGGAEEVKSELVMYFRKNSLMFLKKDACQLNGIKG